VLLQSVQKSGLLTIGPLPVNIGFAYEKLAVKTNIRKENIVNSGMINVIGQTFQYQTYYTHNLTLKIFHKYKC
jgi:hypothetical protein